MATSCIKSTLAQSCKHLIEQSVAAQLNRLRAATYPDERVLLACEKNRREVRRAESRTPEAENEGKSAEKLAVIPYLYNISRRLKKA